MCRGRIDEQRITRRISELADVLVGGVGGDRIVAARHDGNARASGGRACRRLAAHESDRLGRGTDERQAGIADRPRERVVLSEKTVTGMNGVCARSPRHVDQAVDAQVAFTRRARSDGVRLVRTAHMQRGPIAFGIHGHRRQTGLAARANHAHRDLSAIGNQNFSHR
jgi:hypothetical protein